MTHDKDEAGFYRLARLEEVPEGEMLQVPMEDEGTAIEVALTKIEGKIYAFRDICPHMAFPLSIGIIRGKTLECVGHGWEFNLDTGKAIYPPVRKNMVLYQTRIEGDDIWVKVDPLF
ncbi:MAG TPA: Rieske (2Fe-2S) protein [Chloroflexia bacterium]|nr:Rieske (2Fe-2S) protein [Chloroflexia bacterium]